MRVIPALSLLSALCAVFLLSCTEEKLLARTQLMAVVDAEELLRPDIRRMRVQVRGRPTGSPTWSEPTFDQEYGQLEWPFNVAIIPEGGNVSRNVLIEVTAIDDAGAELTLRAITGFLAKRTLALPLLFERACFSRACEGEKTCRAGTCQSAVADPRDLRDYTGPQRSDEGHDNANLDGGKGMPPGPADDASSAEIHDGGGDASDMFEPDAKGPEGALCGTNQADASPGDDCPDSVLCGVIGACNVAALTCCMSFGDLDDRCMDLPSCENDARARCDGPEDCRAGAVCCFEGGGSACAESCPLGNEMCHTTSDCTSGSCAKGRPDSLLDRLWLYWGFCEP